jgi:hypothetical protein
MKLFSEKLLEITQYAPHAYLALRSLLQYPDYVEPYTITHTEAQSTCGTVPKNPHEWFLRHCKFCNDLGIQNKHRQQWK